MNPPSCEIVVGTLRHTPTCCGLSTDLRLAHPSDEYPELSIRLHNRFTSREYPPRHTWGRCWTPVCIRETDKPRLTFYLANIRSLCKRLGFRPEQLRWENGLPVPSVQERWNLVAWISTVSEYQGSRLHSIIDRLESMPNSSLVKLDPLKLTAVKCADRGCYLFDPCRKELGDGAFKKVHLGFNHLRQPVAVAVVQIQESDSQEIAWHQRLSGNKGIVRLLGSSTPDPSCTQPMFLVTEFCNGGDLHNATLHHAPREVRAHNYALITYQLFQGLMAIHQAGAIMKDIKPSNALLKQSDKWIEAGERCDFGLSRPILTPGRLAGSPSYLSPEAWRTQRQTPADDFWAFGLVIHTMIKGRFPAGLQPTGNSCPVKSKFRQLKSASKTRQWCLENFPLPTLTTGIKRLERELLRIAHVLMFPETSPKLEKTHLLEMTRHIYWSVRPLKDGTPMNLEVRAGVDFEDRKEKETGSLDD